MLLVLQVNPKLEQTVTARWNNADRNRKQTGSPQGEDRKSAGGGQEVRRGKTGSPQGVDRKSAGGTQEVCRGQTGSPQGVDRKSVGEDRKSTDKKEQVLPHSSVCPASHQMGCDSDEERAGGRAEVGFAEFWHQHHTAQFIRGDGSFG